MVLYCLLPTADLDQQSLQSDPEESYLRDLPEFPSVEEFPSIEQSLLHFPLRGSSQAEGAQADTQSEGEPLSPASLLIQHLASPLHFVNTHFNGHGRPPGGEEGAVPVAGVDGGGEKTEPAVTQGAQRSLEALSEEIVSTAISTVVQNTLSALLRSSEASEEPSLAEFLPSETPPGALETPADTTANTTVTTAEELGPDEEPDEAITTESGTGEEFPDDTLVPTEEEDFELLDQSELDEELDISPEGQVAGETPDTPPSPQHQPQS